MNPLQYFSYPKQPLQPPMQNYFPKQLATRAMGMYMLALFACSLLYFQRILELRWWIFGIVEVCGFFYFANLFSRKWVQLSYKTFIKRLFWYGFGIRVVWVLISYGLYTLWTGTPFSIGAADELFYHGTAQYCASLLRQGELHVFSALQRYGGVGLSDSGYALYLSIIYFLTDDSIFLARVFKALWSAWTAVLIYKLAARNFGETTGRMAGIFCMLMPNLIYYCSFQLKEIEMVFLAVLFVERADFMLRKEKLTVLPTIALMFIPLALFTVRTALAVVLILAFFCALVFSSRKLVSWGKRLLLALIALLFVGGVFLTQADLENEVREIVETGGSQQKGNMQWRAEREGKHGLNQRFAKYAGAAVFAPMIFTIPFPTMAETPGQENQKMIHGGNFVKNILSGFTIFSMFLLLLGTRLRRGYRDNWRLHVLPIAVMCGYLVVLVFSNFAHSERFHQPVIPLELMFAAYGVCQLTKRDKRLVNGWYAVMLVAAIAWNWFKLAGRGLI